jgi:DNA-binding NtrC family response regulator
LFIKGLYIEDDKDNIQSYGRYFEDEGIEIVSISKLFDSVEDYYNVICKENVDFVIIDNHLDKAGVPYDGFDVLKAIRKIDPSIYLLLLTNFQYTDRQFDDLSEFDQTVLKKEFGDHFLGIINRIKRAHARRISQGVVEEVNRMYEVNSMKIDSEIDHIRKLNLSIEELLKQKTEDID